jgi:hypothetical protein
MHLYLFGLTLDFLGAIALAIASSIQTNIIFEHMKLSMNIPGGKMGMIDNAVQRNLNDIATVKWTNRIIIAAYVFFVGGFGLQIYYYLYLIPK